MNPEQWTEVDDYLVSSLVSVDPELEEALAASEAAGLPAINVAPNQGKLLQLMARMCGARRILEIGTLGGYSTIWLARALPKDGRLVTLEIDPDYAKVARGNFENAGLADRIELKLDAAKASLDRMIEQGEAAFDFVFIDADKVSTPDYFQCVLKLTRSGSVIVVDNVIRNGEVISESSEDPSVRGVRRFNEMVAAESRVSATALQTVGSKGYDGFALLVVN